MKIVATELLALCLLVLSLTDCRNRPLEKTETAWATDLSAATEAPAAADEPAQSVMPDDYLASVREQADAIRESLEMDPLTQSEMNRKSQELREIWDAALKCVLDEAKEVLTETEMDALAAEQNVWLEATEKAVEAAGKEFEGGSMHALIVNSEAAALTEARVSELYERLK